MVEVYSGNWVGILEDVLPNVYCKELTAWLCIGWVFKKIEVFDYTIEILLR